MPVLLKICLLLALTIPRVWATDHVVWLDDSPERTLNQGELSLLIDSSRTMTRAEVAEARAAGRLQPLPGNLGLGYRPAAAWLHFTLNNPAADRQTRWIEIAVPYLDDIRLYHEDPSGLVEVRQGGDHLPQSQKELNYRAHAFELQLEPGVHTIDLRIQTTSTLAAIVKVWQPDALERHLRTSYFGYGLYYSLIFAVLIFNLVNWVVSKKVIFLVYVGYLLTSTVQWLGINGFLAEFILPQRPDLANWALGLSISLAAAMAWTFFMMILELRRYHPFLYRFSQFGIFVSLATFIATLLGQYQLFMTILLFTGLVSLATAPWPILRLWRTAEAGSRLLGLAYIL